MSGDGGAMPLASNDAGAHSGRAAQRQCTSELMPERHTLARFISVMFKYANPKGYVSLRAFPDKGGSSERAIFTDAIDLGSADLLDITYERARQAANWNEPAVFCPPVATFKTFENAKTDNILEGVALSVECDSNPKQALVQLEQLIGMPTMVVASGGEWTCPDTGELQPKLHIHWRLKRPSQTPDEHARLREAREIATNLVGADGTNKAIVHPIRWPGSWHRKKSPPKVAQILSCSEADLDLQEALSVLRDRVGIVRAEHKVNGKQRAANDADVVAALAAIPNNDLAWDDWNRIGMATWGATGGSDAGRDAFATWSAKSKKNCPEATINRWNHFKTSPPSRIGFGTLVYLARKHAPGWSFGEPESDPVDLWAKFDPPSLPCGILPDIIERFAVDQARTMGADPAGIAISAVTVCAAAIPDKIQLQVKKHHTGWRESARLWVALVGPVSSMKSPIMAAAVRPIRRIDSDMARNHSEERAKYNQLSAEERKKVDPPKQTRLLLQDTTIEAAQEVLKDSPDGVLCYQDELSGWFGSMDKYSGSSRGSAKDRAFWLEAYNGAPYSVTRVGRGSTFIENLSISILGGIQPEPIRKLVEDSMDDGLLQRLLPIVLRPAVEGRDEPMTDEVEEYATLIHRLYNLDNPMLNYGSVAGNPTTLRFDDEAQSLRQELERKHLEFQQCEAINSKLAAHIGKYNGIFARLCVVWHCVEHAGAKLPCIISTATARRVKVFLHTFLLPHAMAFYAGTLGLSNDHERLTATAGYILAHKLTRITNRDVQRGDGTMRKLEKRDIEALFEQLDALGWIMRTPGPRPTDPPHWIVNPLVHTKFAERARSERERRSRDRTVIAAFLRQERIA